MTAQAKPISEPSAALVARFAIVRTAGGASSEAIDKAIAFAAAIDAKALGYPLPHVTRTGRHLVLSWVRASPGKSDWAFAGVEVEFDETPLIHWRHWTRPAVMGDTHTGATESDRKSIEQALWQVFR